MAVRIRTAALIIPRSRLDRRWPGGSEGLIAEFEREEHEFSYDGDLVAITLYDFRDAVDYNEDFEYWGVVERFCGTLRHAAVVDEEWGPVYPVDWLDFVRIEDQSWAWMPPRLGRPRVGGGDGRRPVLGRGFHGALHGGLIG